MTSYAALLAILAGCNLTGQYCEGDWAAAPPKPATGEKREKVLAQVLPVETTAVDILFVIDDSPSMSDEQEQLGIWSNALFDVLASGKGELPDLHVAVTSSGVEIPGNSQCQGSGGRFRTAGIPFDNGDLFLRDVAGPLGRERNYAGTLAENFAKMARVGDSGCGFEQPLAAAQMALSANQESFLREDALLLLVFVTDEDDCSSHGAMMYGEPYADACSELGSMTSYRCFEHGVVCHDGKGVRELGERTHCEPAENSRFMKSVKNFAEHFKWLKKDPAQVVVAGIYGKPNRVVAIPDERITSYLTPRLADVCGSGGVEGVGATPAIRLNGFLAEFGGRASQSSICDSELSWALRDAGLVTRAAAKRSPCLHGAPSDTDRATPGVQPRCRVHALGDGVLERTRVEIPACTGGEARCFTVAPDATCATTSQLAVRVFGAMPDETLSISCEVEDE